ncbi:hypothetical protein C8R43DRAFT_151929 [Mycena crocata]|nr:hypothetical protein C8R43DRAFT_151929 [Mycena crocata]
MADSSFDNSVLLQGPSFHVDLPPIDARHMFHFSRRLIFFRCASSAQRDAQLAALKIGIQALLLRCPILAGVVTPLPPDEAVKGKQDWRTIIPGEGLELVIRDRRGAIPSLEELEATGFPPHLFPWHLVMPISRDLDNSRSHAACKMQFSAIDGGTILTFATSHCVGDGGGQDAFTRILIDATRLAQTGNAAISDSTTVGIDRSVLCNMVSDLEFNIDDHPAYRWKTTQTAPPSTFGTTAAEIPVLVRFSADGLAQLKADATTPDAPPISTHDALAALMWRTVLLIRSRRAPPGQGLPPSTTSNLFMPSDARRHLSLPSPYVGNAVYQLIAGLDLGTLLSPAGLPRAAIEVRRAITAVTPARVASYMAFIRDPVASRLIDYQFMNGTTGTTSFAMGTCLGSSGVLYGGDWGEAFGPVLCYRLVGEATNVVLPKLLDGSAEVIVSVLPEEEETVRSVEGFGKYVAL